MTTTMVRAPRCGARLSQCYMAEINAVALLNADEERALAHRVSQGDYEARDEMIRLNLRLVVRLATAYRGRGLDLEDLVSEGNFGLIRAAEEFNAGKGVRFSTYASYWIKQTLSDAVRDHGGMVRVTGHVTWLASRWRRMGWGSTIGSLPKAGVAPICPGGYVAVGQKEIVIEREGQRIAKSRAFNIKTSSFLRCPAVLTSRTVSG